MARKRPGKHNASLVGIRLLVLLAMLAILLPIVREPWEILTAFLLMAGVQILLGRQP